MVSGFVTSPCDQLRIFSGDASMMRIASKSVMGLVSSNGLERNIGSLLGEPFGAGLGFSRDSLRTLPSREAVFAALKKDPKYSGQRSVVSFQFESIKLITDN
jgi:hypothetical protein